MSKRIYPVTVENGELVESNEKLTVNGLPIAKDGTIDSSYVSGSSSEWTVDANGNLVPKDGEPVQVGSLRSDEQSIAKTALRAGLNTDQTISSNTTTKVELDTVEFDHFNGWDGTNHVYTIPEDGTYILTGSVQINTLDDGDIAQMFPRVNGSSEVQVLNQSAATDQFLRSTGSTIVEAVAGDEIDLAAYHNQGTDQTIRGLTSSTHLTIGRVG